MKLKLGRVVMLEHENQQSVLVMERLLERMSYELLNLSLPEFTQMVGQHEYEKKIKKEKDDKAND